jgi:hypothetical protein
MRIRLPHPATIVAIIFVVLALTGTATAAALVTGAQIKNNTVASVDLKNNSAGSVDILNNSLKSIDVKDGSLLAADFAAGQLAGGPAGPVGPAGPQGPPGPQGSPGLAALEVVSLAGASNSLPVKQVNASCPAGKTLIGGGAHIWNAGSDVALDESYPATDTTWRATAYEVIATGANWHLEAYAICAVVAA